MTPAVLGSLRAALAGDGPVAAPPRTATAAAVLVPLFERDGALHLLYTRRSAALPTHPGQVAFPGGRHAPGDGSLLATALRETEEEIGIARTDVDVLGALDPIHTLTSNFLITPFVGRVPHPYPLRTDPREVAEVFAVPLAALADPGARVDETWTIDGRAVPVTSYRHAGRVIWGATQRITTALLDLMTALAPQD